MIVRKETQGQAANRKMLAHPAHDHQVQPVMAQQGEVGYHAETRESHYEHRQNYPEYGVVADSTRGLRRINL